ncbi:MAG TPA: hypothetical protein VMN04_02820 [Thermoanaerobaculia bacterium]|nr:hypothetical protein [Thermoanaerobaculia bacterium]
MRCRVAPVLVLLAVLSGGARADWTDFLPRTLETHAWLELYGLYEKNDQTAEANRILWSDTFLKEKLTLLTNGYIYHPRFLLYHLNVSGALKQEDYELSTLPPLGRRDGKSLEYDAHVVLLPEHPYNLELFSTRYEPLFREQYATHTDTVATNNGVDARYGRRPWFLHARLEDDKIDSTEYVSDVKRLTLDGRYLQDFGPGKSIFFDARYAPSRLTDSTGFTGDTTDAAFGNGLEYGPYRLNSNVSATDLSQAGTTTFGVTTKQLSWFEQFTADLPARLRLEAYWRYQDNRNTYEGAAITGETNVSSLHEDFEVDLKHQLYESLQTTYVFRWGQDHSTGGDSDALLNSLSFNYTKLVAGPENRLTATLSLGQEDTRNAGQALVVDEAHSATPAPGSFLLQRTNVDAQTVSVLARSPQPPYGLVLLTEGSEYTLTAVGNTLEVTILSLPPEFPLPGKYDFQVSYAETAGSFSLRMRTFGQGASLALLNNLVTPYYSVNTVRSDVTTGSFPGALDSDVLAAGVSSFAGPLRARVEYDDVRWTISPWHGWRADLQVVSPLGPSTNVNATAAWQYRHYADTTETGGLPAYVERIVSASGNIQQFLFSHTLSLSCGGSYSRYDGLAYSRSYALNAALTWRVGKLDVSGGASYTNADSQSNTLYASRTVHQYYYLRLKRILF